MTTFTKNTLLDLCRLSTLAYCDQNEITQKYQECPHLDVFDENVLNNCTNCPKILESKENDCEVYVCNYKSDTLNDDDLDCLVIAFRGTSEFRDVLSDINAIRTTMTIANTDNKPWVHWGFYNQFLDIYKELDKEIEQYYAIQSIKNDDNTKTIIFCGHSLGAGLASIASVYYGLKYPNYKIHCVTMGSPRVGSTRFNKLYNKIVDASYRFVNENDVVTMIPSRLRYTHVKGLNWLTDGTVKKTMRYRFFSSVSNSFYNWFGFGGTSTIDDHGCDKYLKNIVDNYF